MTGKKEISELIKKNCFKYVCFLMLAGILMTGLCFTYISKVRTTETKEKETVSVSYNVLEEKMKNGDSAVQTFECAQIPSYIDIQFAVKGEEQDDQAAIRLLDAETEETVAEWKVSASELEDGMTRFDVDQEEGGSLSGKYILEIAFSGDAQYSSIRLFASSIDQYNGGELKVSGESTGGDLSFSVYEGTNSFLPVMFAVLALFLMAGAAVTYVFVYRAKIRFEKAFLFVFLVLGIAHMFLMPAYSTPDERAHFGTAYYYSNILLGEEAVDEEGNVRVRNEDLLLNVENIRPGLSTYALIADNLFEGCKDDTMVSYDAAPLDVPFWSYAPQTLGITLARLLGAGNIMLLLTGDLFALAFYAACIYMAVRLIPFGKSMFAVISLLPMALETAGSFSYDVLVNGLSFLFTGYVFYLAYEKKGAGLKDWILMALIIFILAPVKVVYVLLAFLCLLIPMKSRKIFWIGTAGVIASGGVSCLLLRLTAIMNLAVHSGAGSAGTAENTYTLSYILSNITRVGGVLYNTLCRQTDAVFAPLYGQKLGYWDVSVPYYISFAFVLVLAASLLVKERETIYIKSWQKLLMLVLIVGMTGGITLSMMLDFTDVTDTMVRGIQGRYFIPFLPLAGFLFRGNGIVAKKSLDGHILMIMYMLNYFSLWRIFEEVIAR